MGKKIMFSNNVLIAMDPKRNCVIGLLPYDNDMLYLPLPDTSEYVAARAPVNEDNVIILPANKRETPS